MPIRSTLTVKLGKELHTTSGTTELDIDLQLKAGDFLAITGPSGSGKTTLLRLLAGLTSATRGFIKADDTIWLDTQNHICLPPQSRNVGMVFQSYDLFPNMTVRQNLLYARRNRTDSPIVEELIEITDLGQLTERYPAQLSGGQRQRVALARSLVRQPDLLLLDEPFSALDTPLRLRLQAYISDVHHRLGLTTILVSHDRQALYHLSKNIAVLEQGRLRMLSQPPISNPSQHSGLQLRGEVFSIEEDGEGQTVKVLVGHNLIALPVDEPRQFSVGQTVTVQFVDTQPKIVTS